MDLEAWRILIVVSRTTKNRTVADLKHIFDRHGGNLGRTRVRFLDLFKKGLIVLIRTRRMREDYGDSLDAGAEDVRQSGSHSRW